MFGELKEFRRDPLGFLLKKQRESGAVAVLHLPRAAYLLNEPQDIRHVLVENCRNYLKGAGIQNGREMLGNGLLSSEGDLHRQQARMMQPIFKRDHLLPLADTILATTRKRIARWKAGQQIDIAAEMMRLSLLIGGQTLFSIDFDEQADELASAYGTCQRFMAYKTFSAAPLPGWVPTARNREHQRAIETLNGAIYGIIRKRKASASEQHDFLSYLLKARDEHGCSMKDQQLRDELVTLLLAAHETIGGVMGWFWYFLALHPEMEQKFYEELRVVCPSGEIGAGDIKRLEYTEKILDETMRYYPPPWLIPRKAVDEDVLPSGFLVPAGADVFLSPYAVQRNPKYFPQPERFDPERFSSPEKEKRPPFSYFPFGGGARGCVGEAFARMQGLLVLATIGMRFNMALVPGQAIEPEAVVTIHPRNGIWMELQEI